MKEVVWQPRSIRVEPSSRPQARMGKSWFGMFQKEMSCKRSMQAADGLRTLPGLQMANGLPPHALARFECLMKTAKKYGNQMTTPVRSARSLGRVQMNWRRLVTGECHSSKQLLESLARSWSGRVLWSPWY
ncbi:MAG: hypothetical protein MKZ90_07720 [Pseudomonadales bacterium]|nr:hypothetical protein [Pseudomonadales bacterium]